jgi:hypothetical protein
MALHDYRVDTTIIRIPRLRRLVEASTLIYLLRILSPIARKLQVGDAVAELFEDISVPTELHVDGAL